MFLNHYLKYFPVELHIKELIKEFTILILYMFYYQLQNFQIKVKLNIFKKHQFEHSTPEINLYKNSIYILNHFIVNLSNNLLNLG